ncbi:MAG: type II toxin-antitoxin system RelE/ParE family toxin [Eubacteriales bacterium]|nr:type II toxin-antitoxin system RelE/ParE family toxin [Syntrophomonas sp.]MDD2215688.1 type II toxin-antitoxin system RelE/ParE family toxin [Eubacteriales bacterium]MDD4627470.1 type II toxin-antitoxin system RelE/ParE family toxin [Syntrophomonas sp.]
MARLKIRYTRDAVDDLDSIFDYIAEDNRKDTARLLERIENSILNWQTNLAWGSCCQPTICPWSKLDTAAL